MKIDRVGKSIVRHKEQVLDIRSVLAALILCFHLINGAIGISGASMMMIAIVLGISLLATVRSQFHWYSKGVAICVCIVFVFVISFFVADNTSQTMHYLMYFVAFGIISMLIGMQPVNIEGVLSLVDIIGVICLAIYTLRGYSGLNSGQTMGITYAMLPILLSSIISLSIKSSVRYVSIVNVLIIMVTYAKVAPRGVWITLAVFCLILINSKVIASVQRKNTAILMQIVLILLIIVGIYYVVENFYSIIVEIRDYLYNEFNITISALEKYVSYEKQDKVLNGRDINWGTALELIKNSSGIGYGIGYYEKVCGGQHAHNILLQAACEAGVFFVIPIVIMLWKSLSQLFFSSHDMQKRDLQYLAIIVCSGVINLFYSSVYWMWVPFWFYVGNTMSSNFRLRRP